MSLTLSLAGWSPGLSWFDLAWLGLSCFFLFWNYVKERQARVDFYFSSVLFILCFSFPFFDSGCKRCCRRLIHRPFMILMLVTTSKAEHLITGLDRLKHYGHSYVQSSTDRIFQKQNPVRRAPKNRTPPACWSADSLMERHTSVSFFFKGLNP